MDEPVSEVKRVEGNAMKTSLRVFSTPPPRDSAFANRIHSQYRILLKIRRADLGQLPNNATINADVERVLGGEVDECGGDGIFSKIHYNAHLQARIGIDG
jgi:hypothetical protein